MTGERMSADERASAAPPAAIGAVGGSSDAQSGSARTAFALGAVSGFVDGVGVSYITGAFVSFMSGNTTGAGFALGTAEWAEVVRIGSAIPLYLLAVVAGALLYSRWPRVRGVIYLVAMALLASFALVVEVPLPGIGASPPQLLLMALLVLPMGLLNMTLRRVGGATIGLGYVTGTLVSLGERLAALMVNRRRSDWRYVGLFGGLWLCFFGGAAAGAACTAVIGAYAALIPVLALALVLAIDLLRHRAGPSGR